MPLTTNEIETLARILGKKIYVDAKVLANSNFNDLKSAIDRIDQVMEATTNQAATLHSGETIQAALLNEIQTVAPNFTIQEAGVALMIWTANAANIIDILG